MNKKWLKLLWSFAVEHKSRFFLSVVGVSLGVVMIVSLQILLSSLEYAVESSISERFGDYDMIAQYLSEEKYTLTDDDISMITAIKGIKEVEKAIIPYQGELNPELFHFPDYYGLNNSELSREVIGTRVTEGTFPKRGEVALSYPYMRANELTIGSEVELPFPPYGKASVKISGILNRQVQVPLAVFDLQWLQEMTHNEGRYSALLLRLTDDVAKESIATQIQQWFPDIKIDLRKGIDKERESLGGLRPYIIGLSSAGLIVSALIVISTLQVSIRERQHLLATLRLLGAKRIQVGKIIFFESLIIGVTAALFGLVVGVALVYVFKSILGYVLGIPLIAVIIPFQQVLLSALAGIIFTLIFGLLPAFMASKIYPLEVYQQHHLQIQGRSRLVKVVTISFVIICICLGTFLIYQFDGPRWIFICNGIVVVVGMFILGKYLFNAFSRLLSWLLKPFVGTEGLLAARNTSRHEKKSVIHVVIMAIAIIICLNGSMVLTIIYHNTKEQIERDYPTDLLVREVGGSVKGFSSELFHSLNDLNEVEVVVPISMILFFIDQIDKDTLPRKIDEFKRMKEEKGIISLFGINGIDLATANSVQEINVIKGDLEPSTGRGEGLILTRETSEDFGYDVGDLIKINLEDSHGLEKEISLQVIAIVDQVLNRSNGIYTDIHFLQEELGITNHRELLIKSKDNEGEVRNIIDTFLQNPTYNNVMLFDRNEEIKLLQDQIRQRWFILIAIVAALFGTAILGMMTTLFSSLKERSREFAMIRALGSPPRQIVKIVLVESLMIGAYGGIVGLLIGVALGIHLLLAIGTTQMMFSIPLMIGILIGSPVIGVLSSLLPALFLARDPIQHLLRN